MNEIKTIANKDFEMEFPIENEVRANAGAERARIK